MGYYTEFEPCAILLLLGGVFIFIGAQLLAGSKYTYSKEDRQSKHVSGLFSLGLGAVIVTAGVLLAEYLYDNAYTGYFGGANAISALFALLAVASLAVYFFNRDSSKYHELEARANRQVGLAFFLVFLAAAVAMQWI